WIAASQNRTLPACPHDRPSNQPDTQLDQSSQPPSHAVDSKSVIHNSRKQSSTPPMTNVNLVNDGGLWCREGMGCRCCMPELEIPVIKGINFCLCFCPDVRSGHILSVSAEANPSIYSPSLNVQFAFASWPVLT
ncbi:unnamed protein product, partial [Protopolystoma xenopodis]